jgi:hypothetical protein
MSTMKIPPSYEVSDCKTIEINDKGTYGSENLSFPVAHVIVDNFRLNNLVVFCSLHITWLTT